MQWQMTPAVGGGDGDGIIFIAMEGTSACSKCTRVVYREHTVTARPADVNTSKLSIVEATCTCAEYAPVSASWSRLGVNPLVSAQLAPMSPYPQSAYKLIAIQGGFWSVHVLESTLILQEMGEEGERRRKKEKE